MARTHEAFSAPVFLSHPNIDVSVHCTKDGMEVRKRSPILVLGTECSSCIVFVYRRPIGKATFSTQKNGHLSWRKEQFPMAKKNAFLHLHPRGLRPRG